MPRVRLLSLTKLRPRRPHFSASTIVWLAAMIDLSGLFARNQGGSNIEVYTDFPEPGGIHTISRLISPRAIFSSFPISKQ